MSRVYDPALIDTLLARTGEFVSDEHVHPAEIQRHAAALADQLEAARDTISAVRRALDGAARTCNDNSPAWFAGRWRDWHRGHGCDKDDGRPRTEHGAAEIERHGRSA